MADYRFFSRIAPQQRVLQEVLPEVERMRQNQAYLDFPIDAVVDYPGITISHGEMPMDRPGYKRIYFFDPEDYPELYHKQKVEEERACEAYVKVYHSVNRTP